MVEPTVNIGTQNSHDQFYRYKMPAMVLKPEGRGNGIKTKITNISDVAKALARSEGDIMKFFGYELGTMVKGEVVNGSFSQEILTSVLEKYINTYVICSTCGNPETVLSVKRNELRSKCKACGLTNCVGCDHKLTDHIIKKSMQ